jgi:ketosteroid isomerase-like protein
MRRWCLIVILISVSHPASGLKGQESKKDSKQDEAVHNELRALRADVLDAFNRKDLDALLKHVHPNVVVTWQNAEVSRGHAGIRDYYNKMMVGPNRVVDTVAASAEVDELTILYGDRNGLAFGSLDEDFTLTNGMAFRLPNRWTAHLVKERGRWLISGFHISSNLFDNPVMGIAVRRTAYWVVGFGVPAGAVLALIILWGARRLRRRKE